MGISQEMFAEHCRMHRTHIGEVERGELSITLTNLIRLARALGVPPSTLLQEAGL